MPYALCPYALCPMPYARMPMPYARMPVCPYVSHRQRVPPPPQRPHRVRQPDLRQLQPQVAHVRPQHPDVAPTTRPAPHTASTPPPATSRGPRCPYSACQQLKLAARQRHLTPVGPRHAPRRRRASDRHSCTGCAPHSRSTGTISRPAPAAAAARRPRRVLASPRAGSVERTAPARAASRPSADPSISSDVPPHLVSRGRSPPTAARSRTAVCPRLASAFSHSRAARSRPSPGLLLPQLAPLFYLARGDTIDHCR